MFSFTTICVLFTALHCVTSQSQHKACSQGEKCVTHYQCPEIEDLLENLPSLVSAGEFLEDKSCSSAAFPNVEVCCKSPINETDSLIDDKPKHVYNLTNEDIAVLPLCECGFIENGTTAGETQPTIENFPWLAQIWAEGITDPALLCGGSIISDRYVLTAGHCSRSMGSKINVKVGSTEAVPLAGNIIQVQEAIRHPDYNPATLQHDISLLYLAKPITFSQNVKPICLLTKNITNVDEYSVLGWGSFDNKKEVSSRELINIPDLRPWTTQQCSDVETNRTITDHNICVIGYTPTKSRMNSTLCTGACGGPLTQFTTPDVDSLKCPTPRPPQVQAIAGILSAGANVCMMDGIPSIFMSVPKYIQWILLELKKRRETFDDVQKYTQNMIDKLNTYQ